MSLSFAHITLNDLAAMRSRHRAQLVNALSGIKGVHLVGTRAADGAENLAIFNSVLHIGADPAALGILFRPLSVQRDTYDNIKETGEFTLNLVSTEILDAAHQTSAKYESGQSEFSATGLTPWYSADHGAPYVNQSPIKVGLRFEEEHTMAINGTVLLVGRVQEVWVPEGAVGEDGWLKLDDWNIVSVAGLDAYHQGTLIGRKGYAQP